MNTEIIEKICVALHCDVGDIMEMADEDYCKAKTLINVVFLSRRDDKYG